MNTIKAKKMLHGKAPRIRVPGRIHRDCKKIVKELEAMGEVRIYAKIAFELELDLSKVRDFFMPQQIATEKTISLIENWCSIHKPK